MMISMHFLWHYSKRLATNSSCFNIGISANEELKSVAHPVRYFFLGCMPLWFCIASWRLPLNLCIRLQVGTFCSCLVELDWLTGSLSHSLLLWTMGYMFLSRCTWIYIQFTESLLPWWSVWGELLSLPPELWRKPNIQVWRHLMGYFSKIGLAL